MAGIEIETLKNYLTESYEMMKPYRIEARKVRRYAKGKQLPDDIMDLLESRGQPIKYENVIKKIGNKIMGMKITSRTQMHAFSRQREDKPTATLITQLLRASNETTSFLEHKKRADRDLQYGGMSFMGIQVKVMPSTDIMGKREKVVEKFHISLFEGYPDPYAKNPDGTDSRYFTRVMMIDKEDLYPYYGKEKVDALDARRDEIDPNTHQADKCYGRERIPLCYTWYRRYNAKKKQNEIRYAIWCGDTKLEDKACPFKMNRIPIDITRLNPPDDEDVGEFYGMYRDILPLQDDINFKHLRINNMMGTLKVFFEEGVTDDPETFIEEISKDDAAIEIKKGAINKLKDVKQHTEIAQMQELIHDTRRQCEEIIGLNSEVLGNAVNRLSGSAIESRQNAGLIGLQEFLDASNEQDRRLAEMEVSLIQQYFDAEQTYRIADKDVADEYFTINEIEREAGRGVVTENGKPKVKNRIDVGFYDIILTRMPQNRGAVGERQKAWAEIIKTMSNPRAVEKMIPLMLEDTESPVADKAKKILEELAKEESQGDPAQMQQLQLQMQQILSKIKEMDSRTLVNIAKAQEMGLVIDQPQAPKAIASPQADLN